MSSQATSDQSRALAACIELARKAACGDTSPTSDVYWHTRELCFEIARRKAREDGTSLCFTWSGVVGLAKELLFTDEAALTGVAGGLWEDTMHPLLLVDAVHRH